MLTYQPATQDQYPSHLELMHADAASYLDESLSLMETTWEDFTKQFYCVGQVFSVYQDGNLAGFYWIEERPPVLHLHGLILKEEFQGQGIGTTVLDHLKQQYAGRMQAIELGVHQSNQRAKALYERRGFEVIRSISSVGYDIMQMAL